MDVSLFPFSLSSCISAFSAPFWVARLLMAFGVVGGLCRVKLANEVTYKRFVNFFFLFVLPYCVFRQELGGG